MTRTFPKIKLKTVSSQKQRVYTNSISIQEDSSIIQTHPATLNPPNKAKNKAYITILSKPAYIRDYSRKTRVYMRL